MSLDVSLYNENIEKIKWWQERRDRDFEENKLQYSIQTVVNEYWEEIKPERILLYTANITHNLNKMAKEAGIYYFLWRPDELEITMAKNLIKPLKRGLKLLKSKSEYFRTFDDPDGWGMFDHFVPFVEKYLNACIEFPYSTIEISR